MNSLEVGPLCHFDDGDDDDNDFDEDDNFCRRFFIDWLSLLFLLKWKIPSGRRRTFAWTIFNTWSLTGKNNYDDDDIDYEDDDDDI